MPEKIENRNIALFVPIISPEAAHAKFPVVPRTAELVLQTRRAIRDIIHGRDTHRLVVIAGPCSIHDSAGAVEYAERLKRTADAVREHLVIVMRTYFEKPRTTIGWKGMINDPSLDGSCEISKGLELARSLLLKINALGMPCANEMLDPITPQYIADMVSWAAIGARTIESQTHREMASGLSMPVGFKNGTDGNLDIALNAMISARHAHSFLGINMQGQTSVIKTRGNPDRHIILRGGGGKTNYAPEDIAKAAALMAQEGLRRPVMVDCSHGNAAKDHLRQLTVCRSICKHLDQSRESLMGVMLESNLKAGKQTWEKNIKLEYGVSITDACIGWEDTEALLHEMADKVAKTAMRTSKLC